MSTPSEKVAEHVASALEGRKFRLLEERAELARAQDRIAEIDAEVAELDKEIAVQEPKRPKKPKPDNDRANGQEKTK